MYTAEIEKVAHRGGRKKIGSIWLVLACRTRSATCSLNTSYLEGVVGPRLG